MGCGGLRVSRALIGAIVFVGIIWSLCVGILAARRTARSTVVPSASFQDWGLIGRGSRRHHHQWDLNYVSKRRVPNGPDPIHNRRFSQSRQPPGRL